MSTYDTYDAPPRARYDERYDERYDDRYDDRRDRYAEPRDHREHRGHRVKVPESSRALVHRQREENELTVDRAYPAGYSSREVRRARSAEPGYDDYYDDRDRYYHHSSRSRHGGKRGSAESYYESEEKARRRRVLSRQEKIIAAVAGAALALGGKEVYDRHAAAEAEDHEIQRNYLHSAAFGAAGAVAAYQGADFYNKRASKSESKKLVVHRGHDGRGRDDAYYDDDDDDDPPAKKGHKNFLESALGVTSLGAAMKALTGGGDDKASQRDGASRRGRSGSPSSVRSGKSGAASMNKVQKMAMAGLLAGATEAFRIAKEPGSFKGEKAKRVLTAALGAGAIGGAHGDDHNKRDIAESVIGGLLGNRIVHGSKKNIEEDSKTGRSRSRSRLRSRSESGGGSGGGVGSGGLAALASAGLAAFGAKKAIDSRDDSRGRNSSPDRSRRSRSRSVVDGARRGLAKLGFGGEQADDRRRDDASDYGGSRVSRRHRHYSDESDDDDYDDRHHSSRRDPESRRHRHRGYDDEPEDKSVRSGRKGRARSDAGSSTDLGDSEEDERQARKIRGKQIITTGLASVATIHAAHGMYQSIGNRKTRELAVKAGKMSPTEARALKSKAIVQDAASVGLAVLGVKGALEELKEARDKSHQCRRFKAEKQARHERRVARQRSARDGHRRSRSNDWASPSAVLHTRERSVRRNGESYAETLPPSPA